MKYQDNNTTHRRGHKLPHPRKEYLCFRIDRKISQAEQCETLRALTKATDSIINTELFKNQFFHHKKVFAVKTEKLTHGHHWG